MLAGVRACVCEKGVDTQTENRTERKTREDKPDTGTSKDISCRVRNRRGPELHHPLFLAVVMFADRRLLPVHIDCM